MTLGVGIIGAGPGVAALHVPTLARLAETFRIAHVADAGSGRAAALAGQVGARSSTGIETLLADDDVDVVAICSPPDEHARHVIAAVEAGKRAVFCEKPLAVTIEQAEEAAEVCRRAGVPLIVGTNHCFDPAWGRAKHHLARSGGQVVSISVTLALPPNTRYHELVAEIPVASGGHRPPDLTRPEIAADVVRRLLVGLGIHDLPLVRDLAPRLERVLFARAVPPLGCAVGFIAQGIPVQFTTVMLPGGADALWRITVTTSGERVDVTFPPAFVHAGGAEVRVRTADGRDTLYSQGAIDGYIAEWRALAELLDAGLPVEYDELLDDARYALRLADEAAALVGSAA
ncbi:Gfo/Idh/MocA family protein [Microbacterium sp. YJN-G]|uniref:Gfo/Idh/MocA family protein n=1 Tax=Microbacterium sp. YJN-G TaxID=2763257 RepID=UPI0018780DA2|nr:Gfo/Idh/MocA family oxidoreductase [Microbacterium sp. YJN-G]